MRTYVVVLVLVAFAVGITVGISACAPAAPANGATSSSSVPSFIEVGKVYSGVTGGGLKVTALQDDGWVRVFMVGSDGKPNEEFGNCWWNPTTTAFACLQD